jgi:hypothetical protein
VDEDLEVRLGLDRLYPADVPADAQDGQIDDGVDPARLELVQADDGVRHVTGLVESVQLRVVDEEIGVQDEHVLVHQDPPQLLSLEGSAH